MKNLVSLGKLSTSELSLGQVCSVTTAIKRLAIVPDIKILADMRRLQAGIFLTKGWFFPWALVLAVCL